MEPPAPLCACQTLGQVSELMTPSPVCAEPEWTVGEVLALMGDRRIRHVPIVDAEGLLVGLVSQRDLVALDAAGQDGLRIGEMMHTEVDTVDPTCCAGAAARHMLRTKRSSLPVVDAKGAPVGILTEADFLRHAAREWPPCTCRGVTAAH